MKKSITLSALIILFFLLSSCAGVHYEGRNQSTSLENSGETTIFLQAVGIGSGVGLGVGLLACDSLDGVAKKLCIASTTAIGGGIGYYVAQEQINNLDQVHLENDQLSDLVTEARRYNNNAAAYNSQLKQEISQLKQSRGRNPKNVADKLNEVRNKRNKVTEAINVRRSMLAKLSDYNQRKQYEQTLNDLNAEIFQLDNSIQKFEMLGSVAIVSYAPAHNIPQFPWPPPKSSAFDKIPSEFLNAKKSLKDVANKLEETFDQTGYTQKKYYSVPDGFALVSQLEQFWPDGTSKEEPDRWAAEFRPPRIFSLTSYIKAIFKANPGRYRIVAFIVTSQPFEEGKENITREEARSWLDSGMVVLPKSIGEQPYTDEHYCTALIYEFEQPRRDKKPFFKSLSNLTGRDHLQKSKLWAALKPLQQ